MHSLYGVSHKIAVLWVNGGQILFKCGRSLLRISAVNLEQLLRPVLKKTRWVKCPTSHMGKALRLNEIKLALLKRSLGAFAIFDVGRDPLPLHDVSIFIPERHSAVQMPAILPIRAAGAHLAFVRLAGSNRFPPFGCMSLKIIRVN